MRTFASRCQHRLGKLVRSLRKPSVVSKSRSEKVAIKPSRDLSFEDMALITLDAIGDAVLVVNLTGEVIFLNKVAQSMTGWQWSEAIGQPVHKVFAIVDGLNFKPIASPSSQAIEEDRAVELALGSILVRHDGTEIAIEDSAAPIHNHLGQVTGAVVVFHDARLSGSILDQMSHQAQHDFLTDLPNRLTMVERLTQAMGMAKRHGKQIALLFLDLDSFKNINDCLGHSVGDKLLRDLSSEIVNCVRFTDTVSRYGGDEFLILLSEIEDKQDAAKIAEKLLNRCAKRYLIDGHEIYISCSIGISIYPDNGMEPDDLIKRADEAMYQAKEGGRNSYRFSEYRVDQSL